MFKLLYFGFFSQFLNNANHGFKDFLLKFYTTKSSKKTKKQKIPTSYFFQNFSQFCGSNNCSFSFNQIFLKFATRKNSLFSEELK